MAKKTGKVTKHPDMSRQMCVAKAICRWVAKHIEYDWESFLPDLCYDSYRRSQDALLTFERKMGECAGKSDLTALMMRIAGIPTACVTTISSEKLAKHEYNAIYLKDENNTDRTGWVLLDTDWETLDIEEGCNRDTYEINDTVKAKIKDFCLAFYSDNLSFKSANEKLLRQPIHKICRVFNCDPYEKKFDFFEHKFTINECNYQMCGIEGKSAIKVDAVTMIQNQSAVTIHPDIENLGMKINVGSKVKSLVLRGDETIDLSKAENLKNIDATKSNKYYIKDFKLYDKKTMNLYV